MTLCTAAWLERRAREDCTVDARHHYIVAADEYDPSRVERYFRRRVAACEGATWRDVAARVALIGGWEFVDYSP